mgnify:CR=1 FL=1
MVLLEIFCHGGSLYVQTTFLRIILYDIVALHENNTLDLWACNIVKKRYQQLSAFHKGNQALDWEKIDLDVV